MEMQFVPNRRGPGQAILALTSFANSQRNLERTHGEMAQHLEAIAAILNDHFSS